MLQRTVEDLTNLTHQNWPGTDVEGIHISKSKVQGNWYGKPYGYEQWVFMYKGVCFTTLKEDDNSIINTVRKIWEFEDRWYEVEDDGEFLILTDPLPWLLGKYKFRHQAKETGLRRMPSVFDENIKAPKIVKLYGRAMVTDHYGSTFQASLVIYEDGKDGLTGIYPVDLVKVNL